MITLILVLLLGFICLPSPSQSVYAIGAPNTYHVATTDQLVSISPQILNVNLTINLAVGSEVTWNCPLGGVTLIAPYPMHGRPYLTDPVDPVKTNVSAGATLWGIYYLDEAIGEWLYFIPGFTGSTLTLLEPDKSYMVVVSHACDLFLYTSTQTHTGGELPPSSYLPSVPRISIQDVKAKLDLGANIVIVDSRAKEQYDQSHIIGAISLPLDEMHSPYDNLKGYDEIITYCT
jgi:hypothetical protein